MCVVITVEHADGSVTEWTGPSDEELMMDHKYGVCNWSCGYCYAEACDYFEAERARESGEQAKEKDVSIYCPDR